MINNNFNKNDYEYKLQQNNVVEIDIIKHNLEFHCYSQWIFKKDFNILKPKDLDSNILKVGEE